MHGDRRLSSGSAIQRAAKPCLRNSHGVVVALVPSHMAENEMLKEPRWYPGTLQ